ncbi:MAG: homoserine kinase [Acidobacteria bacterium]|nr:homoserine kinase [Acidobacteriota bacterium]
MAVYTRVGLAEIQSFASEYRLGRIYSIRGIPEGIDNTNYVVLTGAGPVILTVYEKWVDEAELPFFVGLMDHLSLSLPCPRALPRRDGRFWGRIKGRPAAFLTHLKGAPLQKINGSVCRQAGKILARLHVAAQNFSQQRDNRFSLEGCYALLEQCKTRAGRPPWLCLVEKELAFLRESWPKHLPWGIIHGDFFPDNALFQQRRLTGIVDFYFACNDFLAYDLVICMNSWCFDADGTFDAARAAQLFSGYQEVRTLSKGEVDSLSVLARGAAVRFILTRFLNQFDRGPGLLLMPRDPLEYLNRLQFYQHRAGPFVELGPG